MSAVCFFQGGCEGPEGQVGEEEQGLDRGEERAPSTTGEVSLRSATNLNTCIAQRIFHLHM